MKNVLLVFGKWELEASKQNNYLVYIGSKEFLQNLKSCKGKIMDLVAPVPILNRDAPITPWNYTYAFYTIVIGSDKQILVVSPSLLY